MLKFYQNILQIAPNCAILIRFLVEHAPDLPNFAAFNSPKPQKVESPSLPANPLYPHVILDYRSINI